MQTTRTTVFNPMSDAAQGWDVHAWLLAPSMAMADPQKRFFVVTSWNVQRMRHVADIDEPVVCWSVGHNGTPTDLRRAVVTAAVRVAEGK